MNTTPTDTSEHDLDLAMDLDHEVRRLIDLHRRQWKAIASASGVSHSWLSKFARGKITNPGYATLKRLHRVLSDRPVTPPPLPPVLPGDVQPKRRTRKQAMPLAIEGAAA